MKLRYVGATLLEQALPRIFRLKLVRAFLLACRLAAEGQISFWQFSTIVELTAAEGLATLACRFAWHQVLWQGVLQFMAGCFFSAPSQGSSTCAAAPRRFGD